MTKNQVLEQMGDSARARYERDNAAMHDATAQLMANTARSLELAQRHAFLNSDAYLYGAR